MPKAIHLTVGIVLKVLVSNLDVVTLSAFKYGKAGESPKVPPFVRTTVNILAKDTGNEMLLFPLVVDEYNPHCN